MVEQELAATQREYDLERENYKNLSERHTAAQMQEQLAEQRGGERFSVLNKAFLPASPESPNRLTDSVDGAWCRSDPGRGRRRSDVTFSILRYETRARCRIEFDVPVLAEIPRIRERRVADDLSMAALGLAEEAVRQDERDAAGNGEGRARGTSAFLDESSRRRVAPGSAAPVLCGRRPVAPGRRAAFELGTWNGAAPVSLSPMLVAATAPDSVAAEQFPPAAESRRGARGCRAHSADRGDQRAAGRRKDDDQRQPRALPGTGS